MDTCEALRAAARMAVPAAKAYGLHREAVQEGRSRCARERNKLPMVADELAIHDRDSAPDTAEKFIHDVTEMRSIKLVEAEVRVAKVRAARLAAGLRARSS